MNFPSNEMQKELAPGFESCVQDRYVVMSGSLLWPSWFFISCKEAWREKSKRCVRCCCVRQRQVGLVAQINLKENEEGLSWLVSPRESEIVSDKGAGLVGPLFGDGHTELHIKVFFNDQQKWVFRNWTSEDAISFLSASFYMAALPSHSFSL